MKEKKKTRRERTKNPALQENLNLRLRKDYIETDYINGIYDDEGNELMRPLNEDEKAWLNQYYEEVVNANLTHDPEIRKTKKELDALKKKENLTEEEEARLDELNVTLLYLAYEKMLYPDELFLSRQERKENRLAGNYSVYDENNARNADIYNRAKASGMLDQLEPEDIDDIYCYNDPCYGDY